MHGEGDMGEGVAGGVGPGPDTCGVMKEGGDTEKDPGSAALAHKTGGTDLNLGLGGHLGPTRHMSSGGGLPGLQPLHHPFQLAALTSHQHQAAAAAAASAAVRMLYPSLLPNFSSASLMASLAAARSGHHFLNQPPSGPPTTLPPTSGSLANLHATLAASDTARQRDILATLSKITTTSSSTYLPHHDSPMKPDPATSDSGHRASPASFSSSSGVGGSPSLAPLLTHPNMVGAAATTGGLGSETPSPTAGSSPPGSNGRMDPYTSTTPTRKAAATRPDRVFTCKICSRSFGFSDSNQLKAHMLIHKGEKPFECMRCFGRYRRRHHLMHHKCPSDPEGDPRRSDQLQYSETTFLEPDSFSLGTDSFSLGPEEEDDYDFPEEELPPPATLLEEEPLQLEKRRERKSRDPRRVINHPVGGLVGGGGGLRVLDPAHLMPGHQSSLPEQTEPEDLSLGSSRSRDRNYSGMSAVSSASGTPVSDLDYTRPLHTTPRTTAQDSSRFSRHSDDEEPMSSQA
ncbi:hypothetical protein Pmani_018287 [Petrolisthes manimaculis]|uniref:C2H2-type domain-containing protein n=1 Tax=Petrolisthes manimaculis TaxID=1843537 RepID=A0AAE1PKI4_9EUCA|nr:hypothetical protein Pmani_018287 [Petrolisthes manimaculis]